MTRHGFIRVVFRSELEVFAAGEPFDIGGLEFADVHEVAHGVSAGTRVLRLPRAFESARNGVDQGLGDVGVGSDGAQVGIELGCVGRDLPCSQA